MDCDNKIADGVTVEGPASPAPRLLEALASESLDRPISEILIPIVYKP